MGTRLEESLGTSHTCQEDKAEEVLSVLPGFLAAVRFVIAQLARRDRAGD